MSLSTYTSAMLPSSTVVALRRLMDAAYAGAFTDQDWQNALGGAHVVIEEAGVVVAHGAVVPGSVTLGGTAMKSGFIEAVAVSPDRQGAGLGAEVMRGLGSILEDRVEVGVLWSAAGNWYERFGWLRWQGPTWLLHTDGALERTPQDDGNIFVLPTACAPPIDPASTIVCNNCPGDAW